MKARDGYSAVIFCGGKSKRMGQDKASLSLEHLHGRTLLEHLAGEFAGESSYFNELYYSVAKDNKRDLPREQMIYDLYEDCGPLVGILSSLKQIHNDAMLVVACDMPFFDYELALELIGQDEEDVDLVIPRDGKNRNQKTGAEEPGQLQEKNKKRNRRCGAQVHMLCGIYKKSCIPYIEDMLENHNYRVRNLLERCRVKYVDVSELTDGARKLQNVNTPEELAGLSLLFTRTSF